MLLWADGFDHYGSTANMQNGAYTDATANIVTVPANVRTGTSALDITTATGGHIHLVRPVSANSAIVGVGFALQTQQGQPADNGFYYSFYDPSGKQIITATFNANNGIDFRVGGQTDPIVLSTPAGVLINGTYSYVEFGYTIDPLQGVITCRVNNVVVAQTSGINTVGGDGSGTVASAGFHNDGGTASDWPAWYLDDYVIWDGSGPNNNNFFGDVRCRTIFPASNGNNQDWTPNGQAQAFNCINQVPPVPGTDFIEAATPGALSSFGLGQVPQNTGVVHGVVMFVNINKGDAGTCTVVPGVASGGQTLLGKGVAPGVGAGYYPTVFDAAPDGNPWTRDKVNGMQALVDRTA